MFVYEKKLQYPVKIKNTNPALAKFIISQYGGPNCVRLHVRRAGKVFHPGGLLNPLCGRYFGGII